MKPQDHRKRRLIDYRPMENSREERAMKLHEQTQELWDKTAKKLGQIVGRDPSTLAMNGDNSFRKINEERYLISQVVHALSTKDTGVWTPNPRIGDLYAQQEKPNLASFEAIGGTGEEESKDGERPTNWFQSKYYKKRVKQLHSYIEKIKPFNPVFNGLEIVGKPLELKSFSKIQEVNHEPEIIAQEQHDVEEEAKSVVKLSMSTNRVFFRSQIGQTQAKTVEVTNDGTSAVYFKWEIAKDVELMIGSGAKKTPIRKPTSANSTESPDVFDWRSSESFTMARNIQQKNRSEFLFSQVSGSILPGNSAVFSFSFKSDVPGCFTQRWVMRTTPSVDSETPLVVVLRGCCEISPPDLTSFKASIDESLHESERSRSIEEIISSIFERVSNITSTSRQINDEAIEGDVLIDDRAPVFEQQNKEWNIKYSPAIYASLHSIAERVWDSLGIYGFNRYWDNKISSLSSMIMKLTDGNLKRELLNEINQTIQASMTVSAGGSLNYSIAFVQLSTFLDELPALFANQAQSHDIDLPPFIAPKVAEMIDDDDNLESTRRKHKGKREQRKPPSKKPKKGKDDDNSRGNASTLSQRTLTQNDFSPEFRDLMKATVKEELIKKLRVFEYLAGESTGVNAQLTRVNEVHRLDTDLMAEVEDDDI